MPDRNKVKLAPSIMCANFACLEDDIKKLEKFGVDYFHFDIMDGHFVPNLTMGPDIVRQVRKVTTVPFDIHLMVEHPEKYINTFTDAGGDLISIHVESSGDINGALKLIKDAGKKSGLVLNPETPISAVDEFLDTVSVLVIMCVSPGFAGQKMVQGSIEKISKIREKIDARHLNIEIEVDGNVGGENLPKMAAAGADILVCGTSSIFRQGIPLDESLKIFDLELRSWGLR